MGSDASINESHKHSRGETSFTDPIGGRLADSRILVIDDSPLMRALITKHLRNFGFLNLAVAGDGAEGLRIVREWHPDLVLTDLLMPTMDGFEFCHHMRSGKNPSTIPILALTGMDKSEDRSAVFSAGATDLITKPIDHQELIGRLKVHLERRRLIERLSEFQRRMNQELELARGMQETLMPNANVLRQTEAAYPIELASHYEPSIGLGGDIWGLVPLDGSRLKIFAADFSGHGVGSALNTFRLHTFMTSGKQQADTPAAWLDQLNLFLCSVLPLGQFATMFCAVMDFARNTLTYASAGAPPQLLLSADDDAGFRLIDGTGFPLGLTGDATFENIVHSFPPGSKLMLYSDALIETPDPPDAVFTCAGLQAFVDQRRDQDDPQALQNAVLEHLYANANMKPEDDLTVVTLNHIVANGRLREVA